MSLILKYELTRQVKEQIKEIKNNPDEYLVHQEEQILELNTLIKTIKKMNEREIIEFAQTVGFFN